MHHITVYYYYGYGASCMRKELRNWKKKNSWRNSIFSSFYKNTFWALFFALAEEFLLLRLYEYDLFDRGVTTRVSFYYVEWSLHNISEFLKLNLRTTAGETAYKYKSFPTTPNLLLFIFHTNEKVQNRVKREQTISSCVDFCSGTWLDFHNHERGIRCWG